MVRAAHPGQDNTSPTEARSADEVPASPAPALTGTFAGDAHEPTSTASALTLCTNGLADRQRYWGLA